MASFKCVIFLVALNVFYVLAADTTFSFKTEPQEVNEDVGTVKVIVQREGNELTKTAKVHYATKSGTAKAGEDFVGIIGTLIFYPGEDEKTIPVQIIDDKVKEPTEHFSVELTEASIGDAVDATALGAKKSLKITIKDNDK